MSGKKPIDLRKLKTQQTEVRHRGEPIDLRRSQREPEVRHQNQNPIDLRASRMGLTGEEIGATREFRFNGQPIQHAEVPLTLNKEKSEKRDIERVEDIPRNFK